MANDESNEFPNARPFQFVPLGAHEDGTDYSSAVVATLPAGASKMMIQTVSQNIRVTLDGTTPDATTGFQITASRDPIIFPLSKNTTVTIIEEAATADVQIQFGY